MATMVFNAPRSWAIVVLAFTATLVACGGDNGGDTSEPPPPTSLTPAQACTALANATIQPTDIGRPVSGVRLMSSELVGAAEGTVEYCKITGAIDPVDAAAPVIQFQVNLPTQWNGKALHLGGGGYGGSVVTGVGTIPGGPAEATPLSRGYVTFGSDSGHQAQPPWTGPLAAFDASFGLNDEALANYAGDQIKKTHDVAIRLIRAHYGKAQQRTYFAGGSGGGREAFVALQRFTADYDGIIAYYPAWPLTQMLSQYARMSSALVRPGAYITAAKAGVLYDASLASCDPADGIADGLISNPAACTYSAQALRCPTGGDEGEGCLSDAQLDALEVMGSALTVSQPMASGETTYPGFNITSGADMRAALGSSAPALPVTPQQPFPVVISNGFVRYWVTRDPGYDPFNFDPENPGVYQQRLSYLSSIIDMAAANLDSFEAKGGKLIIVHGSGDSIIPAESSRIYYQRLVSRYGDARAKAFARYYEVPGYGHGNGAFTVSWDSLSALEQWVENRQVPDNPVAKDVARATAGRTRPLCAWPLWPKYSGSGDESLASSFTCSMN